MSPSGGCRFATDCPIRCKLTRGLQSAPPRFTSAQRLYPSPEDRSPLGPQLGCTSTTSPHRGALKHGRRPIGTEEGVPWSTAEGRYSLSPFLCTPFVDRPGRTRTRNPAQLRASDARSQFDRQESKGRLLFPELRCNDRRSFPVVDSTHAKSFAIGLFQLSTLRVTRCTTSPCSWGLGHNSQSSGMTSLHIPSLQLEYDAPTSVRRRCHPPPPPSVDAFYIGCGVW